MHAIRWMGVAAGLLTAGCTWAADALSADAAKSQYDAERARCMSGTTGQDQASCLRSAGAAYDAIRQGRLHDANSDYRENALVRCRSLPASDRADCESRVDGDGLVSGSVKAGGDIKETITRTVGTPVTVGAPANVTVPVHN